MKFYRALEDKKLRRQDISVHEDLSKVEKSVGESEEFQLLKFFGETPGRFLVNQINTLEVKGTKDNEFQVHGKLAKQVGLSTKFKRLVSEDWD
ncbi:hypothetical protein RRG08_052175 [Elysia crispata]|uniref:Uncharacterized protein n=1 Tax=Elysia crispata TaxID=231223 RepID=A0AAE0Z184_9GAST|nr:hypothetical protein RRG08_052175 [Elysia crispata]